MSARPLDIALAELAERPEFLCTDRTDGTDGPEPYVHLKVSERDALLLYCRTARAALERINKDDPTDDPSNVIACDALRDLDAIAGEP